MGPALVFCVLGARIWSGAVAAVLLALVAGSSLALFAVLTKGVVEAGEGGVGALLRAPELYAWLAVALAGMVFQQASFRAGALTASLPTMTLAKPVVGWILGITVLSETLRVDDEKLFVLVAAVIVMIVSTVALARGEAATMEAVNKRRSKAAGQPLAPSERSFGDVLSTIAIIPSAPVLVPELAGAAADEVAELRAAMVAAVAALPPRWVVVGVGSNDTADVVVGPESVGTFAGFGADLVVRLSPQASGRPVELPLCALITGWMRDQAQPDAPRRSPCLRREPRSGKLR